MLAVLNEAPVYACFSLVASLLSGRAVCSANAISLSLHAACSPLCSILLDVSCILYPLSSIRYDVSRMVAPCDAGGYGRRGSKKP